MIPEIELKSATDIKASQEAQLQIALQYLWDQSPYYHELFEVHKIDISDIRTLEDLSKLPTTTKTDLQQHNDKFLCVSRNKIIDYVTTSGTLGEPVTFAMTDNDLNRLAINEAISFACAGVSSDDTIQLMTTMDRRFMAGLAYFLGARQLGAASIRVGNGVPELQWDSILKFKPTYLVGVPSFFLKLIDYAQNHTIDLNQSSVKAAICIGEPIRNMDFSLNTLGQSITDVWDIQLYSTYASTEMSTAFTECSAQRGGHLHPELIIAEILDEQQQPVLDGELGELTITTLGVEAMPLLRFRTGDMLRADTNACSCGRNTLRLGPVEGRKQQMIKYKGTTLYPPAILNVLNYFKEIDTYVIEITSTAIGTDDMRIKIVTSQPTDAFLQEIQDHFSTKLRVKPTIEYCDTSTILKLQHPEMSRKPRFVIDYRNQTT